MATYLTLNDFKVVTNFLTKYHLDIYLPYNPRTERIYWPKGEKLYFDVEYSPELKHITVPRMSKKQAALAVVIYNDVQIRWYHKSRNRGTGANFTTEERTRHEWEDMVKCFLAEHPDFKAKNWKSYLVPFWPDNNEGLYEN